MRLSATTTVVLRPANPPVPFEILLSEWGRAGFEPGACRRVLERLVEQRNIPREMFCPEAIEQGGRPATDALLFDFFTPSRDWICTIRGAHPTARRMGVRIPVSAVSVVARMLREIGPSRDRDALRAAAVKAGVYPRLVDALCACVEESSAPAPYGTWRRVDAPGIYRREHASVVIRSHTTTLVVDPQGLNEGDSSNNARYPAEPAPLEPDAVVITHQHEDHWHLPSILNVAGDHGAPVIVPITPRPNLLTAEDYSTSAERAGLTAIAAAWGTTTRVGDIEIDALPFFGEQPTRDPPGPQEGLRSWGNCYRFNTPEFCVLLLVDSGIDPIGSMLDVVRQSVAERGPPDIVLSNCRAFPEVVNPGLAHYVLAVPFSRVRSTFLDQRGGSFASVTLGEAGVAEACAAAGARYFLPYAHMFAGLGVDADGGALDGVSRELERRGVATRAVAWNPGDVARVANGRLWIERA
jgi:L-ascorbate metabolism protein UlaG (beta-lactamase superfamily)